MYGCFFPRGLLTNRLAIDMFLTMFIQYMEVTLYILVVATSGNPLASFINLWQCGMHKN